MKGFIILGFTLLFFLAGIAQTGSYLSSIVRLKDALNKAPEYDKEKQHRIALLKQNVDKTDVGNLHQLFRLYESLYNEYKQFQYDSSFVYARKMQAVSLRLHDQGLVNYTRMKLSFSLLSAGLLKEATDSISLIDFKKIPDTAKAEYYALKTRYFYDLGLYSSDSLYSPLYYTESNKYLDSSLALWNKSSFDYQYNGAINSLVTKDSNAARIKLTQLLVRKNISPHQVALTATAISSLDVESRDYDEAIEMLIKAVIGDIESCTKETVASYSLSTLLYKRSDIENASLCVNKAIADADFYGARQRKIQVSAILPVIEAQKYAIIKSEKTRLIWFAVSVCFLLLLVISLATIVFNQVKKLKKAQKDILEVNLQTQEINKELLESNDKLNDANKIKEEYIGYFFNVNSEFFDKIERFKKSIDQKIIDRKIDEIRFLVNNINLKREKEELIKQFDRAFLKLFPNFVSEFNELFKDEDRIVLKDDELLNTDLRIFALYRMGIQENERIANILQYSVNTINTYKTRIKNKSIVPNEDFENRIMKIRTIK